MNTANPSVSKNAWRVGSPGIEGWQRTAHADDPNKYFMVSADCHVTESLAFLKGIEPQYRERVPRVVENADGSQHLVTEGNRPQLVRSAKNAPAEKQQPYERPEDNQPARARMEYEDLLRLAAGRTVEQRLSDQARDGVDAEILFPTTGLLCWATPDPVFAMAMC